MLLLLLNTEGNRATGIALKRALKQCDSEDIVDLFNVKMVTDNDDAQVAQSMLLLDEPVMAAFREENGVNNKGGSDG